MDYTELEVWLESRKLVKQVYLAIQSFPKDETFGLSIQIKRASVSVASNIAEGCARQSSKETYKWIH